MRFQKYSGISSEFNADKSFKITNQLTIGHWIYLRRITQSTKETTYLRLMKQRESCFFDIELTLTEKYFNGRVFFKPVNVRLWDDIYQTFEPESDYLPPPDDFMIDYFMDTYINDISFNTWSYIDYNLESLASRALKLTLNFKNFKNQDSFNRSYSRNPYDGNEKLECEFR